MARKTKEIVNDEEVFKKNIAKVEKKLKTETPKKTEKK